MESKKKSKSTPKIVSPSSNENKKRLKSKLHEMNSTINNINVKLFNSDRKGSNTSIKVLQKKSQGMEKLKLCESGTLNLLTQ